MLGISTNAEKRFASLSKIEQESSFNSVKKEPVCFSRKCYNSWHFVKFCFTCGFSFS